MSQTILRGARTAERLGIPSSQLTVEKPIFTRQSSLFELMKPLDSIAAYKIRALGRFVQTFAESTRERSELWHKTPESLAALANEFMNQAALHLGIPIKPQEFDPEAIRLAMQGAEPGIVLAMRHFEQQPSERTIQRRDAIFDAYKQWEERIKLRQAGQNVDEPVQPLDFEALQLASADLSTNSQQTPSGKPIAIADLFNALWELRHSGNGRDDQNMKQVLQKVLMMRRDANESESLTSDSLIKAAAYGLVLAGIAHYANPESENVGVRFVSSRNARAQISVLAAAQIYAAASGHAVEYAVISANACPNVLTMAQAIRIMARNNGDFPWNKEGADAVFGEGTWEHFHSNSPSAIESRAAVQAKSMLSPNIITVSAEHTQGLTDQQIAADLTPQRMGNGGFLAHLSGGRVLSQIAGFFKS